MITKFKIFENNINNYKIGDYILYKIIYSNNFIKEYRKAKIININKNALFPFRIIDIIEGEKTIQPPNIIRHLKPDEIEKFEIELKSNKYNL